MLKAENEIVIFEHFGTQKILVRKFSYLIEYQVRTFFARITWKLRKCVYGYVIITQRK